ncbi:MAG: alanine racemase [Clostridia bacterium]|nr:alanine racemase [Clostridia bacterium]
MKRTYSTLPDLAAHKAWAEVSSDALIHNYRFFANFMKEKNPDARMITVVKADGYCHSNEICIPAFLSAGCDFFAVSSLEEAVAVREIAKKAKKHPEILILGYTLPSAADTLARYDIIQCLLSLDYAKTLSLYATRSKVKVRVHVKVDTGMNRVGFAAHSDEEIAASVEEIREAIALPGIRAEGLFSHFARSEEDFSECPEEDLNRIQYERFRALDEALCVAGTLLPMRHICNGAGAVRFPAEYAFEGVRFGLWLYGIGCPEFASELLPALKLKTVVAHLHPLLPGEGVGYGSTYRSDVPRTLATLPIGYADGFLRAYRDGIVTIHTKEGDVKAPLVGRICMDQCMVDVTGLPVALGDTVTLFGNTADEFTETATRGGTIEHEVLCLISSRIPRIRV